MNETGLRRMRKTVGSVYDTERRTDVHMPGMRKTQTLRSGAVSRMRNDNTSGYMGAFQRIWKAARPHVEIWGGCAIGMAAVWAMMYAFLAGVGG